MILPNGKQLNYKNGISVVQLRALAAMAYLQQKRRPITWRALMRVLGYSSPNAVSNQINALMKNELIAYDEEDVSREGRGAAASLVTTCRFIPADQLGAGDATSTPSP